jgi:hypothetical protein
LEQRDSTYKYVAVKSEPNSRRKAVLLWGESVTYKDERYYDCDKCKKRDNCEIKETMNKLHADIVKILRDNIDKNGEESYYNVSLKLNCGRREI